MADITIAGGKGDDTLTGSTDAEIFLYEGGKDTITNYSHEDTIQIKSGRVSSYSTDGGDLIFKIGSGTLRLNDMSGRAITVKDSSGTKTKIYGTGYSGQQVIKNMIKAWNKTLLSNVPKLDEAIKLCSHFNNIQEAIDQMVADCKAAGDADTFLRKYCGIILDNEDTGAITGWDAGGLTAKTANNVVPETLSTLQSLDDYAGASFTRNNVTINIDKNLGTPTAVGKKILDGLYSWWGEESLKLVEESYGVKFSEGDTIDFSLASSSMYWGLTSNTSVTINAGISKFNSDDDYNGNGVDRCIAHEFTHVAQNLFMGYFPQFLQEGLAELTHGIDDQRKSLIKRLAGSSSTLATCLNVGKNGTGYSLYYAAGYMFFRYLAKQTADAYDKSYNYAWKNKLSIKGTSDADTLAGMGKSSTIRAGAGDDSLSAYGDKMYAYGETGNDLILTNGASLRAYGGNGNDTIKNRGSITTLSGGAGADFILNGGYWDYEFGGDKVSLGGGAGNDTIISHGEKSVLTGGAGDDIIYNGYLYYENWNEFYEAEDDSPTGSNTTILGGTGNDTIQSAGSQITITGGKGADVLFNDGGANVLFTYKSGDGDDYISGFNSTSTLSIGNGTATYTKEIFDDAILLTVGNNTITIDGAASLNSVNILGKEVLNNSWSLNGAKATYGNENETLITVNGVKSLSGISISDNVVTLKKSALKTKVSVNGGGYEFDFAADYSNAKITGSKNADIITTRGQNISISGGKGNDTLTSSGEGNTFIYASGDGNDIIADFSTADKIKITKGTFKVTTDGSDVLVKVGSGSIKLTDAAGQDISIIDKNGTIQTYPTAAGNVAWFLEDDNNFSADNQLGSLIETKDYSSAAQIDSSTDLFKENQLITYSNKK